MHRNRDYTVRSYVRPHHYVGQDGRPPGERFVCVDCGRHLLDYVHTPGARHDAKQRKARR